MPHPIDHIHWHHLTCLESQWERQTKNKYSSSQWLVLAPQANHAAIPSSQNQLPMFQLSQKTFKSWQRAIEVIISFMCSKICGSQYTTPPKFAIHLPISCHIPSRCHCLYTFCSTKEGQDINYGCQGGGTPSVTVWHHFLNNLEVTSCLSRNYQKFSGNS